MLFEENHLYFAYWFFVVVNYIILMWSIWRDWKSEGEVLFRPVDFITSCCLMFLSIIGTIVIFFWLDVFYYIHKFLYHEFTVLGRKKA